MIRINLLRDSGSAGMVSQGAEAQAMFPSQPGELKEVITKLSLVVLPALLLLFYRAYQENVMARELGRVKSEISDTQKKLQALDPAVKEMERFQIEKRKLDSQLDVIKRLSKERLKNVKSLDALQSIVPQKAWIQTMKITENKVEISGMATDDIVVAEFMQTLEASIYFASVTLVSTEELKTKNGVAKKFSLKCVLENL